METQTIEQPAAAPSSAGPVADAEARRLSRLKADELILIDIVTEKSRRVELMTRGELFERFRERAADAPAPDAGELLAEAERRMDETYNRRRGTVSFVPPKTRDRTEREKNRELVPTLRAQREAFSRRELLESLLSGDAHRLARAAEAAEAPEEPAAAEHREITKQYFSEVLESALASDCGLGRIVAWDEAEYYHFRPLLSASYARILSAKNNPVEQLCDMVRESSRIYPRPVLLGSFQEEPFNFTPEEIESILQELPKDPKRRDIRFSQSSLGTVYLYSNKYLEDDYADFLVEHIDVDLVMSP